MVDPKFENYVRNSYSPWVLIIVEPALAGLTRLLLYLCLIRSGCAKEDLHVNRGIRLVFHKSELEFVFYREVICKYIKVLRDLAGILGRKLMEGFGLAGDLFDGWNCQMRFNKYHFSPESVGSCGVFLHSDPSFLTILHDDEDVSGLQVVNKHTGELTPVNPVPGTIAVNMGDIAKAWSNGRFCNVKHQVWCLEPKTRYSTVLFVLGPNDKKVEAPPELVDSDHPRLYVPIDIKDYRNVRSAKRLHTGGTLELFSTAAQG